MRSPRWAAVSSLERDASPPQVKGSTMLINSAVPGACRGKGGGRAGSGVGARSGVRHISGGLAGSRGVRRTLGGFPPGRTAQACESNPLARISVLERLEGNTPSPHIVGVLARECARARPMRCRPAMGALVLVLQKQHNHATSECSKFRATRRVGPVVPSPATKRSKEHKQSGTHRHPASRVSVVRTTA